ncbi:nuclear envelope integral membrane protein 1 [Lampris incognitus]|uniref:nuclear envelope integral membrane protein 1 n=1 Tax=Lampris incognitus TaxID=2546036 RepID=UPI0024B610F2|nr:nuclear envelope integral membrane protein 1 [Lampris incognitus]
MAGHMKRLDGSLVESAKLMVLLILSFFIPETFCGDMGSKLHVINLQDGQESFWIGSRHFCYANSVTPSWRQTWTKIQVRVWSTKPLKVVVAEDEDRLQELEGFSFLSLLQYFIHERSNETTVSISLFHKKTCFKIDPADETTKYTVKPIRRFDINLFVVFLAGVFLFVFADTLSRSQIFYYSAGMSTGMIASLIIVIFIVARFLPKKSPFYVLIVGGWSFSVYAIQLVFRNLNVILKEHLHIAFGYTAVVGFISFAVCYHHGPLVNKKSINILSWTLQLFGLLLIYLGIQIQQVAFAIILAAFCSKNIEYPASLALMAWRRVRPSLGWKPEPRRLLTEEEFQKQGEEETRRALEDLRKYCSSPECSPWKAVSRLQYPKRFAGFVEGSPHLMPNEVSVHAQEYDFGGSFFEDELYATDEDEEDLKALSDGD